MEDRLTVNWNVFGSYCIFIDGKHIINLQGTKDTAINIGKALLELEEPERTSMAIAWRDVLWNETNPYKEGGNVRVR